MTENNAEAPRARPRFLPLQDVSEVLNVSKPQAYALVRSGDLPAIKVGGRGQWRVEATDYLGSGSTAPPTELVSTVMTRTQRRPQTTVGSVVR